MFCFVLERRLFLFFFLLLFLSISSHGVTHVLVLASGFWLLFFFIHYGIWSSNGFLLFFFISFYPTPPPLHTYFFSKISAYCHSVLWGSVHIHQAHISWGKKNDPWNIPLIVVYFSYYPPSILLFTSLISTLLFSAHVRVHTRMRTFTPALN